MATASRTGKLIILGALLAGCEAPPPESTPYQLTIEEVAYVAGCMDMGERLKVAKAGFICADLDVSFIKRHKRPGEQ